MSLVPDYESSSENESSTGSNDETETAMTLDKQRNECQTQQEMLPSASALLSGGGRPMGVVFNNPYKNAENEKIANLEKHVKMVATEEHTYVKNGKKMCWNFRKGRCRFGSNCTFSHDSDLHKTENEINEEKIKRLSEANVKESASHIGLPQKSCISSDEQVTSQIDKKKKLKRPGLSNSIIPSKKVMQFYNKNK